jgi:hypothetical protein
MRTGNLKSIENSLSYFILDERGEVYLVGMHLEKNVEKELKKAFKKESPLLNS